MEPSTIGPYRVVGKLGEGGMGEVYLAEDTRLKRRVALKRVSEGLESPESRERLMREARAAANLNHPNIAVVYDVIENDGLPFIVMEYVEGETLRDRLKRGPMTSEEVLEVASQVTDALAEAHRHGIVHRDLKPSNLLITPSGRVKILDFGLAKTPLLAGESATTTGHIVGTPAYMAPEQMLGYETDQRADIYSFGLVLFELVSGRKPFDREKTVLTIEGMRNEVPRVSGPYAEPIARAMSWDRSNRYQSATQLKRDLERAARAEEDAPTRLRESLPPVDGSPGRSSRKQLILPLSVVVLLAVFVGVWLATRTPLPDTAGPAVVAVLPFENVSGDPSNDHVGVGIAQTLVTKLSALPSITTISRSTAPEYGAPGSDAREVAQALGATFVVKGSVQRQGDLLLITVNLVRSDDSIAWGDEMEGSVDHLFQLQRRLAEGLTDALHVTLTPEQQRRLDEPPTANVDAYADYSQGRYFLERSSSAEDLERGIHLLEGAVRKDPAFALAYAALGEAYWSRFEQTTDRKWTEKARAAATEAQRLDSNHPSVHYVLAVIEDGTGHRDEALSELRRALALQPNYDDAYHLQGEILANQGKVEEAADALRQAIAIRPNFWGHYHTLGLTYYRAGRFDDAVEAFRRVTELQPDMPVGFQSLGATYHVMGKLDAAVSNYQRALELRPNAPSYNNLGTVFYRQGKFDAAARSYEEALKLDPNRSLTYRNLGDAYWRLGETARADDAYRRAAELHRNLLEVNPRDGQSMSSLALMEAKLGNFDRALELAEQSVDLAPTDADVFYNKGVVQVLAGNPGDALTTLQRALELGYPVNEAREDDDLAALHNRPEFQQMMKRMEPR